LLNIHNIIRTRKNIIIPILRLSVSLFYKKKYLSGRHFDKSYSGWIWAIRGIWFQKILGFNRKIPWPCGVSCYISNPKYINFHPDDLNNFQSPGTYFQNFAGRIFLGHGCYIGPNVGIITANHSIKNLDEHEKAKDIIIGEKSWLGMNAVVMPGVVLGPHTIVGAGSIVTKSFPKGSVVLAGNPATIIRHLKDKPLNKLEIKS